LNDTGLVIRRRRCPKHWSLQSGPPLEAGREWSSSEC